jgi:hypothetical protein
MDSENPQNATRVRISNLKCSKTFFFGELHLPGMEIIIPEKRKKRERKKRLLYSFSFGAVIK